MKIIHRLSFNKNDELEASLSQLGYELKISPLPGPKKNHLTHCNIDEKDKNWPVIKNKIQGYEVLDYRLMEYEKKDYEEAQWFSLSVSESAYPQPQNPQEYRKATYDLTHYCTNVSCHIGAKQNKPFKLNSDIKNISFMVLGLHWVPDAIFCRPEAKRTFEEEGITGIEFTHPVLDKSSKEIHNLWQVEVKVTLPPGYISPAVKQHFCSACGRVKYSIPQDQPLTFKKSVFENSIDFAHSAEWFGTGGMSFKITLVSRKVYELVNSLKWKGMMFRPIILTD
jgi:hypothetical protein